MSALAAPLTLEKLVILFVPVAESIVQISGMIGSSNLLLLSIWFLPNITFVWSKPKSFAKRTIISRGNSKKPLKLATIPSTLTEMMGGP